MDYYDHNEDRLERAIAAMRDVPQIGEVPANEILDKIAASRDAAPHRPLWIVERIRNMKPVSKIAASVLLFLGLMSLVVVFTRGNNALAFDTVAEQLHNAGTMTVDMTIAVAGQTMTGKMMFKAPSSFRRGSHRRHHRTGSHASRPVAAGPTAPATAPAGSS